MKVLFVTREYPPFEVGGISIHTYNLVRNIKNLGVSCKVLSFGDETFSSEDVTFVNPTSSIIERNNVPLGLNAKIPMDIIRFSRIAERILRNEEFDVIHVEEPYVGALVTARGHQIKISTFHTTSFGEIKAMIGHSVGSYSVKRAAFYSSIGFLFELIGIKSSTNLIVPTESIAHELRRVYGASINKVKIIGNGVELPKLNSGDDRFEAKEKLGFSPKVVLLLGLGRIVERKQFELLIKAAKILQEAQFEGFRVVIVGEGPDRSHLKRLVYEHGLQNIVDLPGRVSDEQKELYYRAADIFVLTSSYEGFPLTMLEAMSYGVAVINSRIESTNILRDGIDSLSFPAGDFRALSACIKTLLINSSLRRQLSFSAREFAEKRSWKKIAEETLKLYENLL